MKAKKWLDLDVETMGSLLQQLERIYDINQISSKFELASEELALAIDDERWVVEVDINHALHHLVRFNDRAKAQKILSGHDPYKTSNPELIEVYLDVFSGKLNHVAVVTLAERVVELTDKAASKLQYRLVAAVAYFNLNDIQEGEKRALYAVMEYEACPEAARTIYGRVCWARAYKSLGEVSSNELHINKAVEIYAGLVSEPELAESAIADIWFEIGDCQRNLNDFKLAEANYLRALKVHHNPLVEVFLSRVLVATKRPDEARQLLEKIDVSKFSDANKFDYAISLCELAIMYRVQADIDKSLSVMKDVKTNDPLFMQMNKELIVQLYELTPSIIDTKADSILARINRYVTLNPNFAGVGFNFNAMLDDVIKRGQKK
ncbi:hypothetical protein [Pseudomonas turukhanskensis]|uniref:hypothetical protein n=1 Tax=Pseudomonas turukhanskensis TaxID=1806536 RepID=UPI0022F2F6CE|nr:hypothetical protein [Pseudomonas turukhanskensis]